MNRQELFKAFDYKNTELMNSINEYRQAIRRFHACFPKHLKALKEEINKNTDPSLLHGFSGGQLYFKKMMEDMFRERKVPIFYIYFQLLDCMAQTSGVINDLMFSPTERDFYLLAIEKLLEEDRLHNINL